ncbi:MarR family winged helix-turn-helix transcriptional regulator [Catenulispora sp. EB89]|uniref:MarR family winged helix-turn-helix transcriptional regulator n=1 Tax=Catenulispora sp. EB89 TaxID=3156257 RepID=UPI003519C6C2
MTVFARRARAFAGRLHPELTLVSYTVLAHLEDSGGCLAKDLAARYGLDKSTVSRQVQALERLGFLERRPAPEDHRAQMLHLTPAGADILAQVTESRYAAVAERLEGWGDEDITRFAELLTRYNVAPETSGDDAITQEYSDPDMTETVH